MSDFYFTGNPIELQQAGSHHNIFAWDIEQSFLDKTAAERQLTFDALTDYISTKPKIHSLYIDLYSLNGDEAVFSAIGDHIYYHLSTVKWFRNIFIQMFGCTESCLALSPFLTKRLEAVNLRRILEIRLFNMEVTSTEVSTKFVQSLHRLKCLDYFILNNFNDSSNSMNFYNVLFSFRKTSFGVQINNNSIKKNLVEFIVKKLLPEEKTYAYNPRAYIKISALNLNDFMDVWENTMKSAGNFGFSVNIAESTQLAGFMTTSLPFECKVGLFVSYNNLTELKQLLDVTQAQEADGMVVDCDNSKLPINDILSFLQKPIRLSLRGVNFGEKNQIVDHLIHLLSNDKSLRNLRLYWNTYIGPEIVPFGKAVAASSLRELQIVGATATSSSIKEEFIKILLNDCSLLQCDLSKWHTIEETEIAEEVELKEKVKANLIADQVKAALKYKTETIYRRSKLMVCGAGGAGKTTLIKRLLGYKFDAEYNSTVVGEAKKQVQLHNINIDQWTEMGKGASHILENDFRAIAEDLGNAGAFWRLESAYRGRDAMPTLNLKINEETQEPAITEITGPAKNTSEKVSPETSEKIVEGGSKMLVKKAVAEDSSFIASQITFSVWDLAGQTLFHPLHYLFLTKSGVYFLLFNLRKMEENADREKDILNSWFQSFHLNCPKAPIMIMGTHCLGMEFAFLKKTSIMISKMTKTFQNVNIILNKADNLCFFPIDNSQEDISFLNNVKAVVKQLFLDKDDAKLHGIDTVIPAAWVYVIDLLVHTYGSHVETKKVLELTSSLEFPDEEAFKILDYFSEIGAIISFADPNNMDEKREGQLSDIVVLNPEWLMRAFACIIYDFNVHTSKTLTVSVELEQHVEAYEAEGILSAQLMHEFWSEYSAAEQAFFLSLLFHSLVASKYNFYCDFQDIIPLKDSGNILIPLMMRKETEVVDNLLPLVKDRKEIFIQCTLFRFPIGFFGRVVSIFVSLAGHIEGNSKPLVSRNYAEIPIREIFVYLNHIDESSISLSVLNEDSHMMPEIAEFLSMEIDRLNESVFDNALDFLLLVPSEKDRSVLGNLKIIKEAYGVKKFIRSHEPGRAVELSEFSTFIVEPSNQGNVAIDTKKSFDCFLAHEWGLEADKYQTHQIVKEISISLHERKVSAWFDENNLRGAVAKGIIDGLSKSRKVVVFLTQRYIKRVDELDTNCSREFHSAVGKGQSNVIIVVLDKYCLNPGNWGLVGYFLNHKLYVDMSSPELRRTNIDLLVEEINRNEE